MEQAVGNDVVEGLDDAAAQETGGPLAFHHPFVNLGNPAIAKRIVIAGVDDRRCCGQAGKQIFWECRHALHGDCDDEKIHSLCCLRDIDGSGTGGASDLGKRLGTARVCDQYSVLELAEV